MKFTEALNQFIDASTALKKARMHIYPKTREEVYDWMSQIAAMRRVLNNANRDLGLVLDELDPGWRQRVVEHGITMGFNTGVYKRQ